MASSSLHWSMEIQWENHDGQPSNQLELGIPKFRLTTMNRQLRSDKSQSISWNIVKKAKENGSGIFRNCKKYLSVKMREIGNLAYWC